MNQNQTSAGNDSCCFVDGPADGIYLEVTTKQFIETMSQESITNSTNVMDTIINRVRIAIAVIHITVFFFGLTGNGIILYTILKVVKNRSVTDMYILSLAISDFLFVATLPFLATDMLMGNDWIFGVVVCKIFVSVNYLVLCAGVFIVTAMSVDRFQNVVFAVKMRGVRTTRRAKFIIYCLWGFSVLYMIPATLVSGVSEIQNGTNTKTCLLRYDHIGNVPPETVLASHTIFRFVVVVLVPFVVMVCCNATIVHFLRRRRVKNQKKKLKSSVRRKGKENKHTTIKSHHSNEDRITRLILLVTSAFLVCFLPNLVLNAVFVLGPFVLDLIENPQRDIMLIFRWSSVCLLYVNSALNPLLYAYSGSGFRQRINEALFGRSALRKYMKGVPEKSVAPSGVTKREIITSYPRPKTEKISRSSVVLVNVEPRARGERNDISTLVCYSEPEEKWKKPDLEYKFPVNGEDIEMRETENTNKEDEYKRMHPDLQDINRNFESDTLTDPCSQDTLHDSDTRDAHLAEVHVNDNDSGISAAFDGDEPEVSPNHMENRISKIERNINQSTKNAVNGGFDVTK